MKISSLLLLLFIVSCQSKENSKWEKLPYQEKESNIIRILDSLNSTSDSWNYGIQKDSPNDSIMMLFRKNKFDNRVYVDSVTKLYKVNYIDKPVKIDTIFLEKFQECYGTFISQDMSCLLCYYLDYTDDANTTIEIFDLLNGKSVFKHSFNYFIQVYGDPFDLTNNKIVFSATKFNRGKYDIYIYNLLDNSLTKIDNGKNATWLYPYNRISYLSEDENQIYQYDLDSEEVVKIYDGYSSLLRNSLIINYKWDNTDSTFYVRERRKIRGDNKFFWRDHEFFLKER